MKKQTIKLIINDEDKAIKWMSNLEWPETNEHVNNSDNFEFCVCQDGSILTKEKFLELKQKHDSE